MMLPECRHRKEEIAEGRWTCSHPGIMAPKGVVLENCLKCAAVGVHCNKRPLVIHLRSQKPKNLKVRVKTLAELPCIHRGAEVGTAQCPTCAGHVMVKLFKCNELGQCTLVKPVQVDGKDVPTCDGCKLQRGPVAPRLDENQNS